MVVLCAYLVFDGYVKSIKGLLTAEGPWSIRVVVSARQKIHYQSKRIEHHLAFKFLRNKVIQLLVECKQQQVLG